MRVSVLRQHLQRTGPDRRLGLLRRVQQDIRRGAVGGRRPSEIHTGVRRTAGTRVARPGIPTDWRAGRGLRPDRGDVYDDGRSE